MYKELIEMGNFNQIKFVLRNLIINIFKWNEEQIKLNDILATIDFKPLFGNKRAKTHWLVFMKE